MEEEEYEDEYEDCVEAVTPSIRERLSQYREMKADTKMSREEIKKQAIDARLQEFLDLQSAIFDSNMEPDKKIKAIEIIGRFKSKWENAIY